MARRKQSTAVETSSSSPPPHAVATPVPTAAPSAPAMVNERVPLESIQQDPANLRKHGERNLETIAASLGRFGQQKPIVVDAAGIIRAGNGTYAAAKALGWKDIWIVRTTLNGSEAIAYAIADNRTAELAEWDIDALGQVWKSLGEELQGPAGFSDSEMTSLLESIGQVGEGLTDADEVPAPPDAAVTQPGDLWILGNHRLLCGDSGNASHLDQLLGGATIHLVNTDPPYNVNVEPRSNNAIAAGNSSFKKQEHHHHALDLARFPGKNKGTTKQMRAKDRPLANDFITPEAFDAALAGWFGNISRVLEPGRVFYIWGGYANCANYPPVLKACGLYFAQAIIWVKQHPVLTRKDFMGNHEWCFYGWREGAGHKFFGPANATDVWQVKKVNPQSMVHLTEKPVELAVLAMHYSSLAGENVLDLFGGSGSTLIAAEQTGRHAFLMELDAPYCDVIVNRYQQFTGKRAILERTGKSPIPMVAKVGETP